MKQEIIDFRKEIAALEVEQRNTKERRICLMLIPQFVFPPVHVGVKVDEELVVPLLLGVVQEVLCYGVSSLDASVNGIEPFTHQHVQSLHRSLD